MNKTGELLIQDFNNNLLAYLDPAECSVCYTDKELNGQNLMYITTDRTQYAAQFLVKNNRVMFFQHNKNKWQEYIISETTMYDEAIEVQLESSLYATFQNWIEFVDITGNTVINGMQKAFTAAMPTPQWSPGRSDITGSYYMQRTRTNLKAWIFDWVAKVGGELEEEITIVNNKVVRKVNILSSIGADLGKTLYDDRDLTDINIKDPSRTIYTAAFGYGKMLDINDTGESQPTTFKDIVWTVAGGDPVDKPLGQEWVALPDEYKQKFGYYDINNVLQHSMGSYKEEGVEVPSELLRRTYDFLIDNVSDKTEYSISAIDLFALTNESIELNLGDMIGIEVKQLNYKHFRLKTMRYKESLIDSSENDFELNNTTSTIADVLVDNDSQISDLKDRVDGLIGGALTGSVLDKWNEEINKDASYFTFASPQDGLVVYNANTVTAATKATQLKGGSLRISNTKTSGQFNWTTVLTGDGIIATAIYTGILAGNMFDLDLDSGIVKMGTRNASGIIANPSLQLNADGSINMKIGGADLSTTITNINDTVGDLNTSVDNVVQEVEGIQIGATNLLQNTGLDKNLNGYTVRGNYAVLTRDTDDKYNGNNSLKIVASAPSIDASKDIVNYTYENGTAGENLVVSFYVKGTPGSAWIRAGYSGAPRKQFNVTANWQKIEIDLGNIPSDGRGMNAAVYGFNIAGTFYINSMKMEYGTKPTTWSPAPQDTASRLVVVEQDVVIAQNNIVSLQTGLNGIQADVGQITTTLTTLKSAGSNLAKNTALVEDDSNWQKQVSTWSRFDTSFGSRPYTSPAGTDKHWFVSRNDATWGAVINTMFPAKEGQEYISSCWYFYNNSTDTGAMYLAVFFLDSAGNRLPSGGNKFIKLPNTQAETWLRGSYKIVPPAGTKYMQLYFDAFGPIHGYMSAGYIGEGNIDNGWSPNANDINTEIVTTKTDLAQLHIETDNITQRVTKVEQQEIGVANVLKDSGEQVVTTDYLMRSYNWYGVKPNTTYTIVMNGFTSVATKKIGVWFNGGTAQGGYFPVTTTAKTMVLKVTTPATLTQQYISFYNYPSGTAGTGTINWVAMYEGDVKPPLTWTAAPQELAKISYVEQKTTAEALTTTISSGLASGSQIKTAKYIMDVNGFTIFNAAFTMYDGLDTNSNRVLYFDSSDASFAFVGKTLQYHNNGNIGLKIFESVIELYSKQTPDSRAGQIFASYTNDDRLVIGADIGNKIYLSTQATAGSQTYNAKFGVTENYSVSYVPFYFALAEGHESYMVNTTTGSKIQFANNMNFEINSTSKVFLRFNSTTNILDCGQQFKFGMGFYNSQGTYSAVPIGSDNCQRIQKAFGSGKHYMEFNTTSGSWGVDVWESDGRAKKNIQVCTEDATAMLRQIKMRQFDWKQTDVHQDIGFIAQELMEVKQDLVYWVGDKERLQIDTGNIISLLTKALKEQIERSDTLEQKIDYLFNMLNVQMPEARKASALMVEEPIKQYDDIELIPNIAPDYESIESDLKPSSDVIVIERA